MTTNPNDYDPNELRGAGGGSSDVTLGSGADAGGLGVLGGEASGRSDLYRELFLLQRSSGEAGPGRPYLDALPETYATEVVVFEWLEFLVERAGFRRTMDALRYYRTIGWITDGVEAELREYLTSFDETGATGELSRSDHLRSLVFVARLADMA